MKRSKIKMRALAIRWKNPESKDWTDVFPLSVFSHQGACDLVHDVEGPGRGRHQAKGRLKVRGTKADINYAMFRKFNDKHKVWSGVLRLYFTDQNRTAIKRVQWKDVGKNQKFVDYDVDIKAHGIPEGTMYRLGKVNHKKSNRLVRERPGQVRFREQLQIAYNDRCAISGCPVSEALEGAHIDP